MNLSGYVAPEYVQDEGQATLKCDVYSFGVVLLETLSGRKNTEIRTSEDTSLVAYVSIINYMLLIFSVSAQPEMYKMKHKRL